MILIIINITRACRTPMLMYFGTITPTGVYNDGMGV